jgi:CheY-like chemotaxis protein
MNLFTNALDAVREKGGTVDVDLEDVWLDEDFKKKHPNIHPGQHIKLSVKDTGHGIEKSIVKQIFDPFFTTKELGKGTGLGLSVAHGIVKNHGGAISLVSEPNEGTTFFVFLPIDKNLVSEKEQVSTSIPGGQERILLVDDEPQVVNLEKQILERLGYTVKTRENPLEALEDFRAQPGSYDLVVTDMTMPKMTGGELALQLMQIKPDIPIILCTGFSETMTEEKAKSLGIKKFIMKPIKKKNFADSIRQVLDKAVKRE